MKGKVSVARSCPILGNPMDCSPPGSSVHGIFQEEYWSGLPCSPLEDISDPGLNVPFLFQDLTQDTTLQLLLPDIKGTYCQCDL